MSSTSSTHEDEVKSEVTCKSSEENDESSDEIPQESGDDVIHEIRCGLLTAKLHMKRFVCPGIHRKCVEFEGKLISPRQFTIKAEKDKQKDWKGSIRLGRYNLRTLMEQKNLDFYDHSSNCSLKCQSRNYIKNRKNEMNENLSFVDNFDTAQPTPSSTFDSSGDENSVKIPVRKSSTVLEDYVSQTVKSVNGVALSNLGIYLPSADGTFQEPSETVTSYPDNIKNTASNLFTQQSITNQPLPALQITTPPASTVHSGGIPPVSNPNASVVISNGNSHWNHHSMELNKNLLQQPQQHQQNSLLSNLKQLITMQQKVSCIPPLSTQTNNVGNNISSVLQNNINTNKSPLRGTTPDLSNEAALLVLQTIIEQQKSFQKSPPSNNAFNLAPPSAGGINTFTNGCDGNGINNLFNGLPKHLIANKAEMNGHCVPPLFRHLTKADTDVDSVRRVMEASPILFWSRMRSMGLLEDMLNLMATAIEQIKQIYLHGNTETEEFAAKKLSDVALNLDLASIYGEKIYSRYVQSTLESSLLSKELEDLHRKTREQEIRLETVKRKSQAFDQLILKNGRGEQPEFKKLHLGI